MIKLRQIILESNRGLWNWYKQQLPTWPDYVVKDFIFSKLKSTSNMKDKKEWIDNIKRIYPNLKWKLERLSLTFDSFGEDTKRTMKIRGMGKLNPNLNWGSNDAERHQTQLSLIQKRGISKQPIIVIKKSDGYDLWEGWHRTLQYLQYYPSGFTCPAWVGYV